MLGPLDPWGYTVTARAKAFIVLHGYMESQPSAEDNAYPKAQNGPQKPYVIWSVGPKALKYESLEP